MIKFTTRKVNSFWRKYSTFSIFRVKSLKHPWSAWILCSSWRILCWHARKNFFSLFNSKLGYRQTIKIKINPNILFKSPLSCWVDINVFFFLYNNKQSFNFVRLFVIYEDENHTVWIINLDHFRKRETTITRILTVSVSNYVLTTWRREKTV